MFQLRREALSDNERARLRDRGRRLFRPNLFPEPMLDTMQADVLSWVVTEAWVASEATDEVPIYVLEAPERVLCLAGQWLYDSHTFVCSDDLHDRWDMDREFFRSVELRAVLEHGLVLRMRPLDPEFVPVQTLAPVKWKQLRECELAGSPANGLPAALRGAGLIE